MIIYFLLVGFCLVVFIKLKLEVINPLFITFLIWFIAPLCFISTKTNLYPLSEDVFSYFGIYLFSFLGGYCLHYLMYQNKKYKISKINKINLDIEFTPFFSVMLFLSSLILLYQIVRYLMLFTSGMNLYNLVFSEEKKMPLDLVILTWAEAIPLAFFFVIVTYGNFNKKEIVFVILLLISEILKFSKLKLFQILLPLGLFLYVRRKIKIRHLFSLSLFVFILFMGVHFIRGAARYSKNIFDDISRTMAIYCLSPLKAFDLVVDGSVDLGTGHTIKFIRNIFRHLNISIPYRKTDFDGWVYIPYGTNVYTTLMPMYADFGVIGIFFISFIEGFVWRLLYTCKSKFGIYRYCGLSYILYIQFFDDIFFNYTSSVLINALFMYLLFLIIVKKQEKNRLDHNYLLIRSRN